MPAFFRPWQVALVVALLIGGGALAYEVVESVQPRSSSGCGPPDGSLSASAQALCSGLAVGGSTNTSFPGGVLYNFTIESAPSWLKFTDFSMEVRTPLGTLTPFDSVCFEAPNGSAQATFTSAGWAAAGTSPRCASTAIDAPGDATVRATDSILVYMPGPSGGDSLTFVGQNGLSGTTSATFT